MHWPKRVIIDKLHFDDAQVMQYEEVIERTSNQISDYDRQLNGLENALYTGWIHQKRED